MEGEEDSVPVAVDDAVAVSERVGGDVAVTVADEVMDGEVDAVAVDAGVDDGVMKEARLRPWNV